MATEFCTKCKEEHPGRECDFKDGECAGTITLEVLQDAFAESVQPPAGATVHEVGCPCGFCKAGWTKA